MKEVYYSTKKKAAPYFESMNEKKKLFEHFSVEMIFCYSRPIPDLYLNLICKNAHFSMGLQTENGNVFTHSYAISKRIKLEFPDWSQMKDLFKSSLMV